MSDIERKEFTSEIKAVGARMFEFVISSAAEDRDGDTINPSGWRLDAYKRSPVVLFGHDYASLPIARAPNVRVTPTGLLKAVAEFPPRGIYPFADTVHDMVEAGFLKATSVGFRPIKWQYAEGRGNFAKDYIEQELLEFSIVAVGSNRDALLTEARSKSFNAGQMRAWLELDDDVVLELDPGLTDAQIRALVPQLVDRHIAPEIARAVRESMTQLTGRID